MISATTAAKLGGAFEIEALPPATLKGVDKPVELFGVSC